MKYLKMTCMIAALMFALSACEEKSTFEKAGEKMDKAVKDAGNAIEDACEDAKKAVGAEDEDC